MTRFFCFTVLLVSALLSVNAYGEGWSFEEARPEWEKVALGFVGGIVAHETGHYAVATAKGYKVSHDGLSIVYPGAVFTPADHLQVASAGFQTQWLLTELVLRGRNGIEMKEPPGNFGAGVVCAHLAITLAYLTVLKDHRQGDVAGMAQATGRTNNQIALALAIPGGLDAWRLFGNQVPDWVSHVSLMGKSIGIVRAWTY